ncbi:MAG: TadE/TadG family type IV pilus assembly protein [Terracidiphilus sp.]
MSNLWSDSTHRHEVLTMTHSGKGSSRKPNKGRSLRARLRRLFVSDSEGGALVEMAVTLPIVMAVMTGIFSFSIALYQKLQLAEAVSNAGHLLATDRGDNDPCTTATNAIYAAAPGLAQSKLTLTYTLNGVGQGSGTTACAASGGAANPNMVAGGNAEIQAQYTCALGVYGMKYTTCTIASQVTEVVQ